MKTFEAKLTGEGPGSAWTKIEIPFDVVEAFGARGRVSIRGTMNGAPFRNSLFPNGDGTHHMMVNKELQRAANAKAGDTVRVTLEPDDAPRTIEVPDDFRKALAKAKCAPAFEKLAPSKKKLIVDAIVQAKKAETRAARIEKALAALLK